MTQEGSVSEARQFLVEVTVSIRPVGGPVKYSAVAYSQEFVSVLEEVESRVAEMAHAQWRKYVD